MKNISVTGFELSGLEPPGCPTPGACSCNCDKQTEVLQKQLAAAKEDAECAWRNTRAAEAEAAKLRGLLIACRGSVKTDLNAYERLLVAKQKHGEQETPTYTAADAEAQRLFALLAELDRLELK